MGFFNGSGGIVLSKSVTLTDEQIKALPTTGVGIVPAPGVGKIIVVSTAFVLINTSGGSYTNLDGTTCQLQLVYDGPRFYESTFTIDQNAGPNFFNNAFFSGDNRTAVVLGPSAYANGAPAEVHSGMGGDDPSNFINRAINIQGFNGVSGNFTGGDPANTLRVTVLYSVLDV